MLLQEYFAPCEYATPVLTMYEMSLEGKAGLTIGDKVHQIERFRHLLDTILCHGMIQHPDEEYAFKLIPYKGVCMEHYGKLSLWQHQLVIS